MDVPSILFGLGNDGGCMFTLLGKLGWGNFNSGRAGISKFTVGKAVVCMFPLGKFGRGKLLTFGNVGASKHFR